MLLCYGADVFVTTKGMDDDDDEPPQDLLDFVLTSERTLSKEDSSVRDAFYSYFYCVDHVDRCVGCFQSVSFSESVLPVSDFFPVCFY